MMEGKILVNLSAFKKGELGIAHMTKPSEGNLVIIESGGKHIMYRVTSVQHCLKDGVRGPYTYGETRVDVVLTEVAEV